MFIYIYIYTEKGSVGIFLPAAFFPVPPVPRTGKVCLHPPPISFLSSSSRSTSGLPESQAQAPLLLQPPPPPSFRRLLSASASPRISLPHPAAAHDLPGDRARRRIPQQQWSS